MKKSLLFIFLLMGLLLFNIATYAEDEATFQAGDYSYTIKGLKLKVYGFDEANKRTETNTMDDGSVMTKTTSTDVEEYARKEPDRVIDLPLSDYLGTPEFLNQKVSDTDMLAIDLNLNVTEEGLRQLLAEEIAGVSDTKSYIAELEVEYAFTTLPEQYKYLSKIELPRILLSLFEEGTENEIDLSPTTTISHLINRIDIGVNEETGAKEFDYMQGFDKEDPDARYLNYEVLSTEKYDSENSLEKIVLFHSIDNPNELMEYIVDFRKTFKDGTSGDFSLDDIDIPTDPKTSIETVPVEDTAQDYPLYFYIVSIIFTIVGFLVIEMELQRTKAKKQMI